MSNHMIRSYPFSSTTSSSYTILFGPRFELVNEHNAFAKDICFLWQKVV